MTPSAQHTDDMNGLNDVNDLNQSVSQASAKDHVKKRIVAVASCTADLESLSSPLPLDEAVRSACAIANSKSTVNGFRSFGRAEALGRESEPTWVLSANEREELCRCLLSIGCDEVSVDEKGSLSGSGEIAFEAANAHTTVDVHAAIAVKDVWDSEHREWSCAIGLKKCAGCVDIASIAYQFTFVGFGTDADGNPAVLCNFSYERMVDDAPTITAFNKGGRIELSEYDVSRSAQWGYLVVAECALRFVDGSLLFI